MRIRTSVLVLAICCPVAVAGTVRAQELSLLAGVTAEVHGDEETHAWTLEYLHGLGEHAAISLAWLNEGHVENHHRDGQAVQLWVRTGAFGKRLWLSAGAGPYRYFDTAQAEVGALYSNDHGWGGVFSLASTWYGQSRWLYQLRANRILTQTHFDSTTLQFGVGYQLDPPDGAGPVTRAPVRTANVTDNEITVFLGFTIVNSFDSEQEMAKSIEYRRGVGRHVDWTVAWLDEGDARLVRRNGLVSQLWLVSDFLSRRLALGAGAGIYYAVDDYRENQAGEEGNEALSGIVTATGSYRLSGRWLTRLSWNRIVTNYSRDTDVVLAGLGYRF